MMRLATGAALTLAAVLTIPAHAQQVEFEAIEAKNLANGKDSIQADLGYIYLVMPNRANGVFVKTPDMDDIAEYQAEWEEEFAEAVKKYPGRLRRYEQRVESRRGNPGERPVEPTRETFTIGDINRRMLVSFGPQFVFDKDTANKNDKTFSYMVQVEPGEYTWYGPVFLAPNGTAMGACYCMGSIKFEVKPGVVTNLGTFLSESWASDADMRMATVAELPERQRGPADYSIPASLTGYTVEQADLRAAGKMNNMFNLLIARMPPVEGVLAYERDRIVDVKAKLAYEKAEAARTAGAETNLDDASEAMADAEANLKAAAQAVEDVATE